MGLTFKYGVATGQQFHCESKLWLTADRLRVVPDGDPEAAFLFCVPGRAIPLEEAERFGLIRREPDPVPDPLPDPDPPPDPLLEPDEVPDLSRPEFAGPDANRHGPRKPRKAL